MALHSFAPHHIALVTTESARVQFEDPSDARLSDEEARRKIMQRTLTGAPVCPSCIPTSDANISLRFRLHEPQHGCV